jgi:hypothetical protein
MSTDQTSGFEASREGPRLSRTPESTADARMQILATEHWSLLATRSLTYTESFSRVSMFLAVLSGAVIALALIAQAERFGTTFVLIAFLMLSVVIFVGVATIARLMGLNRDDMRWVIGMNRLRHAYVELHPDLEPYFVTGRYDDLRGVLLTLGVDSIPKRSRLSVVHGLQTLPGMLSVIVSVVAGGLAALFVVAVFASPEAGLIAAVAGFLISLAALGFWQMRSIRYTTVVAPRFAGPEGR